MPAARFQPAQPGNAAEHAQKRVKEQIRFIEKLKAEGRDTESAERLLTTYRELLDALTN